MNQVDSCDNNASVTDVEIKKHENIKKMLQYDKENQGNS